MITCQAAGCHDMAGVVVKCKDLIRGIVEYDFCENCAQYLSEDPAVIRATPYANKGLLNKNQTNKNEGKTKK
jgi:hypothetical protein